MVRCKETKKSKTRGHALISGLDFFAGSTDRLFGRSAQGLYTTPVAAEIEIHAHGGVYLANLAVFVRAMGQARIARAEDDYGHVRRGSACTARRAGACRENPWTRSAQ